MGDALNDWSWWGCLLSFSLLQHPNSTHRQSDQLVYDGWSVVLVTSCHSFIMCFFLLISVILSLFFLSTVYRSFPHYRALVYSFVIRILFLRTTPPSCFASIFGIIDINIFLSRSPRRRCSSHWYLLSHLVGSWCSSSYGLLLSHLMLCMALVTKMCTSLSPLIRFDLSSALVRYYRSRYSFSLSIVVSFHRDLFHLLSITVDMISVIISINHIISME